MLVMQCGCTRIQDEEGYCQILLDEGYIKSFEVVEGNTQGIIRIALKYVDNRQKAITGIKRVSKPGLRVYAAHRSCRRYSAALVLPSFPLPEAS